MKFLFGASRYNAVSMPLTPGTRLGPYEILAPICAGGMGEVYKATDTRLDRIVAIKVSSVRFSERFEREARAVASLNQANICTLYDVGPDYLVMEYIEGTPLKGPLPVDQALKYSTQICDALAAAHKKGITHRDLKPANIMVTGSAIKLLDFGIAQVSAHAEPSSEETQTAGLTEAGTILGTAAYMSPEQAEGKPVDSRSDIFSFGLVLYEMLTGRRAFEGDSAIAVMAAILHKEPATMDAPSAVRNIVARCLRKAPTDRFQSAVELRAALECVSDDQLAETRSIKRLIVLPFRVLRGDPDTDFLAFSLPEAIAASLAGLSSLIVRSTLVAARLAGDAPDLKQIAREADVDVVLTGTLLRSSSQLRLTTQLVAAPEGTLIWSKSSQVELQDIFQLQDMLVSGVVESLALPLTAGERRQLSHDAPASAAAYDLYLRANELTRTQGGIHPAIKLYEQCVAMDPAYAPAWARLGRCRWLADKYTSGSARKLDEADSALRRALELNPDLPLAHYLFTQVRVEQGQALEAMKHLLKRVRDFRNDPELYAGLAHACRYCGILDAALACQRHARRLDPNISTSVLHTHFMLGDYQRCLDESRDDFGYAAALALAMLGRTGEAIALLRERLPPASSRLGRLYCLSLRALLEDDRAESLRASDELLTATFRDPEGWYYLARQLCYLGDAGRALPALAHSVEGGFFCYPAMARDPWLDPLRGDARVGRILKKAEALHQEAREAFAAAGGQSLLAGL
jgi:serine/threonine protein kinase/tetratricopeptide (TPR) repeat protein